MTIYLKSSNEKNIKKSPVAFQSDYENILILMKSGRVQEDLRAEYIVIL